MTIWSRTAYLGLGIGPLHRAYCAEMNRLMGVNGLVRTG
jgi:hypothetical protein